MGKALTQACIQCAKDAGYAQLELDVVADNDRALALYQSLGFEEYGRNPRGFNSRTSGYQELVYMMLELQTNQACRYDASNIQKPRRVGMFSCANEGYEVVVLITSSHIEP